MEQISSNFKKERDSQLQESKLCQEEYSIVTEWVMQIFLTCLNIKHICCKTKIF